MKALKGISVTGGAVYGRILLRNHISCSCEMKSKLSAEKECERFYCAQSEVENQLSELYTKSGDRISKENSLIFKMQQMMAIDKGLQDEVCALIRRESCTAEYAVRCATDRHIRQLSMVEDDYISQRAADIREVAQRYMSCLTGHLTFDFAGCRDVVLAVEDIGAADMLEASRHQVKAVLTREGSLCSHAAIIARDLDIPMIIGLGSGFDSLRGNELAVVDAEKGEVYLNPDADHMVHIRLPSEKEQGEMDQPIRLPDGHTVAITASISTPEHVPKAMENRADGIGLYRSEMLFLQSSHLPGEELQFETYRRILEQADGKPVTIRTFDLGSDKLPRYLSSEEANPALGCRGVRFALSKPDILRTQLRALLRAACWGKLSILLPLVSTVQEVRMVQEHLRIVQAELVRGGIPTGEYRLGAMVETPAAAMGCHALAMETDFIQIGYNDLMQYALGVDRNSPHVADLYDFRSEGVFRLAESAILQAHEVGREVCVCGEVLEYPDMVLKFVQTGVDALCVHTTRLSSVRRMLLNMLCPAAV